MDTLGGKQDSIEQEVVTDGAAVLGEKSEKEYKFCPNCGHKVEGLTKHCVSCGKEFHLNQKEKLTSSIDYSNFIQKISPTKEKIVGMKGFILNNFELTHILYFIVFLITLASVKWGIILFLIMTISYYVLSVIKEKEELPLNGQIKELLGAAPKQFGEATETVKNRLKSSSLGKEFVTATTGSTLETPKAKARFGRSSILLIISGLVTIFGILCPGFFSDLDGSLITMINASSEYVGYFEDVEGLFTGSSGSSSALILIFGYTLLIIPIIIIVLALLKSRLGHTIAFILTVVEFFLVFAVLARISNMVSDFFGGYSEDFFSLVFEYNALGFPAYAFACGLIGMIIFSITKLFKKKLVVSV